MLMPAWAMTRATSPSMPGSSSTLTMSTSRLVWEIPAASRARAALSGSLGTKWTTPFPSRLTPRIASTFTRASPRTVPSRARAPGVAEHDGDDGMLARPDLETGFAHGAAEPAGVGREPVPMGGGAREQLETGQGGGDQRRRERVREEVRPGALAQEGHDLASGGREAATGAAQGLAERGGHDVHASGDPAVLGRAAPGGAEEARRVAVIHHHERVVSLRQPADLGERREVAVHGEDTVGGDQAVPGAPGLLEDALEVGDIAMLVAVALGSAEPDAVDDGGVVEGIGDDGIALAEERLEEPPVGVEARGVEDGALGAEEPRDGGLEFRVDALGAADEAHAGQPEAPARQALLGGADQRRVIGQAEVVVGAEVQHLAPADRYPGPLRALDDVLALPESCLADLVELRLKPLPHLTVHGSSPPASRRPTAPSLARSGA